MLVNEDITRSTIKIGQTGARIENVVAVQGRRLSDFLAQETLGRSPDLVKMDIEGAEIEVIASLDDDLIRQVGQWTIEFHDFLGMTSAAEVKRCIDRIVALGFRELNWSKRRNNADVLLVNSRRFGLIRHAYEQRLFVTSGQPGVCGANEEPEQPP